MESTRDNSTNASARRATYVLLIAVAFAAVTGSAIAQEQRARFGIDRLFGGKKPAAKPVHKSNSLIERAKELLNESKAHARKGQFEQAIVVAKRAEKLVAVCEKTTPVRWPVTEESPAKWIARVEHARRGRASTPPTHVAQETPPQPDQLRSSPSNPASTRIALDEVATGVGVATVELPAMPAPDPEFSRPRRVQPLRPRAPQQVVQASPASGEFSRIGKPPEQAPRPTRARDVSVAVPATFVEVDSTVDFSLPSGAQSQDVVAELPSPEPSEVQQAVVANQQSDDSDSDVIPVSNETPLETTTAPEPADDRPPMPSGAEQPGPFNVADGGTWMEIPEPGTAPIGDEPSPRIEHAIVQEPTEQPKPFDATQRTETHNTLPQPLVNPQLIQPPPRPIPDDLVGAAPRLHPLEPTPLAPAKPLSQSHQFLDLNQSTTRSNNSSSDIFGRTIAPKPIATTQPPAAKSDSIWTSALIHVFSTLVGFVLALLFLFRYGSHLGLTLRVEHVNGLPGQAETAAAQGSQNTDRSHAESHESSDVLPFAPPASQAPAKKTAGAIDPPFPLRLVGESTYEDERQAAEDAEREQEQAMIKHIFSQNLELHRELRRG